MSIFRHFWFWLTALFTWRKNLTIYIGVDPARGKDETAVVVAGYDKKGHVYILDCYKENTECSLCEGDKYYDTAGNVASYVCPACGKDNTVRTW